MRGRLPSGPLSERGVDIISGVSAQRLLIHVPIIHTQADLGALGESIKRQLVAKFGERWWKNKVSAVELVWDEIETSILALDLQYDRVRIYQDGLPVCGREMDIVKTLAAAGSRNHALLLKLADRGAVIMGTESADLLVEEYSRVRRLLGASDSHSERNHSSAAALIHERDKFIAERIDATLAPGEIGILFLGMLHSAVQFLPRSIRPLSLLPFAANRARISQALRSASRRG